MDLTWRRITSAGSAPTAELLDGLGQVLRREDSLTSLVQHCRVCEHLCLTRYICINAASRLSPHAEHIYLISIAQEPRAWSMTMPEGLLMN